MSALRTLFRKYWIILIILLWVIAWVNRDWLAGGEAHTETTVERPVPAAVHEAAEPVPAVAQTSDEPSAVRDTRPTEAKESTEPVAAEKLEVAARVDVDPMQASPVTGGEETAQPERAPVTTAVVESSPTAEVHQDLAPPMAIDRGDAESRPVAPAEPAAAEPTTEQPGTVRPAELLSQARDAYRSRGPHAAAQVLSEGLGSIPADAKERADLLGELGNFHFAAGDPRRAFQAYEQALMALSKAERQEMLERLGPVYDRFHPEGRSRLAQFR